MYYLEEQLYSLERKYYFCNRIEKKKLCYFTIEIKYNIHVINYIYCKLLFLEAQLFKSINYTNKEKIV